MKNITFKLDGASDSAYDISASALGARRAIDSAMAEIEKTSNEGNLARIHTLLDRANKYLNQARDDARSASGAIAIVQAKLDKGELS